MLHKFKKNIPEISSPRIKYATGFFFFAISKYGVKSYRKYN